MAQHRHRSWAGVFLAFAVTAAPLSALAAELKALSAGALEPALAAAADGFRRQTGNAVRIDFATATLIRERAKSPLPVELVAAPDDLIDELMKAGRIVPEARDIGKIGVGVAVHAGARIPDISTPEKLKTAVLASRTVVYNRASSGMGVEAMMERLGIADQLADRTLRFPDAESVMAHLIVGSADEIGFGAPTAISLYTGKNLQYVGPVPAELQRWTYYRVAPTAIATPLARAFIAYLATPEARALMRAAAVLDR